MTQRSNGLFVGKTRHLSRHHRPSSLSISEIIGSFSNGEKVAIVPKGNFRNIPHPRYKGRVATVVERRGSAYVVELGMFNSVKKLVVPGIHLRRLAPVKGKGAEASNK